MTGAAQTRGYKIGSKGLPFILNAQIKRDNVWTIQFFNADGDQEADLSSVDSVVATIRETPYASSAVTSATLTSVAASNGRMSLKLADDAFDSLTWVMGERIKCLWIDFTITESSFSDSAADGAGDYIFKLYLSQSIQGMGAS